MLPYLGALLLYAAALKVVANPFRNILLVRTLTIRALCGQYSWKQPQKLFKDFLLFLLLLEVLTNRSQRALVAFGAAG